MSALGADFMKLCMANRDGSHATQANRIDILQAVAGDLTAGGFGLRSARSLKPKHVEFLIAQWQARGLSAGTIKNRMAHVRWCAIKTNKPGMIPRKNDQLGIADREHHNGNKAQKLDLDKLAGVDCPRMQMSVRLMAAFGLRMEEALKFRPELADKGDKIALKASWTKGGRYREVPIHSERHRALLDEAKALCGDGSLIPQDKSYIQHRRMFEYVTLRAGFSNLHGLRHNYAQARFKQLAGFACPKAGGKERNALTRAEQRADYLARLTVSRELGHDRIDITKAYLG